MEKIYNGVIYCRLSKEDGDKPQSNSISSQIAYCTDYIKDKPDINLAVPPITDDGISGVSINRTGFKLLEDYIKNGEIDCVIVRDLSRFSRNYIDAGRYIERIFPSLGIRFIAINDNYDSLNSDFSTDAYVLPFKNLINDTYCKDISVKIRSSLEIKKKNGDFTGAFCPYGYKRDEDNNGKLVIDEDVMDIIKMIFTAFKEGNSIGKIAKDLNELSVLSPMEYKKFAGSRFQTSFKKNNTAKWDYNTVHRILTNKCYIGTLIQGKRGTPNYKVRVIREKPEKEWIVTENAVDPIISSTDFKLTNKLLKRDMRMSSVTEDNTLSGFVFCGKCGASMVRKVVPAKNKKYIYYICSEYKKNKNCSSHSISINELEEVVIFTLSKLIDIYYSGKSIDINKQLVGRDLILGKQIEVINSEILRYSNLKNQLYLDCKDEILDLEEYTEFKKSYAEVIKEKENSLKIINTKLLEQKPDTKRDFNRLSRRLLMHLVDKILIHENRDIEIILDFRG